MAYGHEECTSVCVCVRVYVSKFLQPRPYLFCRYFATWEETLTSIFTVFDVFLSMCLFWCFCGCWWCILSSFIAQAMDLLSAV